MMKSTFRPLSHASWSIIPSFGYARELMLNGSPSPIEWFYIVSLFVAPWLWLVIAHIDSQEIPE